MRIQSRPQAFIRAINQGRVSPLTSPEWVQIPKSVVVRRNFYQKPLQVLLFKLFQRQSYSAINYLSNGINILARDNPVSVTFGPKDTDPE